MNTPAFKFCLAAAIIVASVAAPLLVEHQAATKFRLRTELLRRQGAQCAALSAENQRLSNLLAQSRGSAAPTDSLRELSKLRDEIGRLRQAAGEADHLRASLRQLRSNGQTSGGLYAAAAPSPDAIQAHWTKGELRSAGYGDPVSALQTALWAMSRGDVNALAASVTPQAITNLTRQQWYVHRSPDEEMATAAGNIAESLSPSGGFALVGQKAVADDQTILDVYFEGEGATRPFTMKKIGDEWKFNDLSSGSWP
jgi:hypothetical protein